MADADEGGSSHLNVVSDRILRTRKRAATSEILEDSNGSSSSDDDVDDEPYRVEHRAGKGPVQQDNSEEADDDEEKESEDDEDAGGAPIITRPRYPFGLAPTNYFGDGMTNTVKRLRGENPYAEARSARDPRFLSTFQQNFYTTVILKKSEITHEAQYVDWEYMARKKNVVFNEVIATCADKRIKVLMGFKHSWTQRNYSSVLCHSLLWTP